MRMKYGFLNKEVEITVSLFLAHITMFVIYVLLITRNYSTFKGPVCLRFR